MTDRPIIPDLPPAESTTRPTPPAEERSSHVLLGRLLVGVGVILLGLVNFFPGMFDALANGDFWRFWPLLFVAFGIPKLVAATNAKERHSAAWLIATGVVLLVHLLNLFGLHWGTGWPLWIIAAGVIDFTFPEKLRDRSSGLFLIALGGAFLLWRTYTLPVGWERAWPLLVIFFGVILVWQALFTQAGSGSRRKERREGRYHG